MTPGFAIALVGLIACLALLGLLIGPFLAMAWTEARRVWRRRTTRT